MEVQCKDFPLSEKYIDFLSYDASVEFLEGTTSAGKTTVAVPKFMFKIAQYLGTKPSIIAGLDLGTIEKNIINSDHGLIDVFGDYEDKVEYFGINNASDEDLNNNVEVLFYDSDEFAVKLLTKENEEVILYKTDNLSSFSKTYENLIEKSNKYNGNKTFSKADELKVPYINVDTIINYDDLCGKYIKDTNGMYISNAFQNVIFNLNEVGCNLISESGIKSEYIIENEDTRYFYYNDNFIVFIKEQDKDLPYFSLTVNNLDTLELEVLSN